MRQHKVISSNFECSLEDGYVYARVWGKMTVREAERSASTVIVLAHSSGYDKVMVDISALEWINDLALRQRAMELLHEGSKLCRHMALVSNRPAITYLVTLLAKGGGFEAKSFSQRWRAEDWLASL